MPFPLQIVAGGPPAVVGSSPSVQPFDPLAATPANGAIAPSSAETRLIIEQDAKSGAFVYKTVDPRSQEVLSQYPSEQLLELKGRAEYQPGAVVQQKA